MPSDPFCTLTGTPTEEGRSLTEPTPNHKTKQPSRTYDKLLKGEITSKQYVKMLKQQARSGKYVSRRSGHQASA